jgi:ABC-type transport system involved in multi-copper enzyme maturation permease subunit
MMTVWLSQIGAVIRLEMAKTFFSKRGLWVYLLALAPVAITTIHSLAELSNREDRQTLAAARPVSPEILQAITNGMTPLDVEAKAGEPHLRFAYRQGRRDALLYRYSDGHDKYDFRFFDGRLANIRVETNDTIAEDTAIFASIFQFFFLRLAIFFGCVGVFTNLFRGEMLDRSLHYYLLTPLRREVLVVGKYAAGLIATTLIFVTSAALQMWTLSWHLEGNELTEYLNGAGWGHMFAYLGVTALACLGYGSVFLAAGLFFKNPIIPAVLVQGWEGLNLFLPAALKKVSVIYYLQSLCPIVASPDKDMNQFLKLLVNAAEPVSAPVAILGLLAVTAAVLFVAGRQARRLEINYSTD